MTEILQEKINKALKCDLFGDVEFSESEVEQLIAESLSLFRKAEVSYSKSLSIVEEGIILVTIVNITKNWKTLGVGSFEDSFWEYILKTIFGGQGFSYSHIKGHLCDQARNFIRSAAQCARRIVYKTYNGKYTYFSTIRAHSYSPVSSYEALLDILWEIFGNELSGAYIQGDSDFGLIAGALSSYFGNPNVLDDDSKEFELSGKRYGIKSGIKYLAYHEKDVLERIIDKSIYRISNALENQVLPKDGTYDSRLFCEWYEKKIASLGGAATVRRTRQYIVKDYKQILPKYILDENSNPVIHFYAIRLHNNKFDTPQLYLSVNGKDLLPRDLDTAGNSILMEIKAFDIKLDASLFADTDAAINITAKIIHAGEEIYNSEHSESLFREGILFRHDTKKELNKYEIEPGNYTLFLAPKTTKNISGISDIGRHHAFGLWRLYGEEGESLQFGGRSIYFTSGGNETTRIWLSSSNLPSASFFEKGAEYDIYDKVNEINILLDNERPNNLGVIIDGKMYTVAQLRGQTQARADKISVAIGDKLDRAKQAHIIQVVRINDEKQLFYKEFAYIQGFRVQFNKQYYWNEESSGLVNIEAQGKVPETIGFDSQADTVEYKYGNGSLAIKIPRIKWRVNGGEWQLGTRQKTYWYKELKDNTASIEIEKPQEFTVELFLNGYTIPLNKNKFMLGEKLFTEEIIGARQTFVLWIKLNDTQIKLCEVATKPFFERPPTLIKYGSLLYWRADEVYIGDKNPTFNIVLKNRRGIVFNKPISSLNTKIVYDSLPDGVYQLEIGISKNYFTPEVEIIHKEEKVFGEYEKVRFNDVCFFVSEVINTAGLTIGVKPVVIEDIQYYKEENGFHFYKGNLAIKNKLGQKHLMNTMPDNAGVPVKVNPVMVEMKDSSSFWLTFYDEDDECWIDFTIDKENSMISIKDGKGSRFEGIDICKYKKENSFETVQFFNPNITRYDETAATLHTTVRSQVYVNLSEIYKMSIERLPISVETLNALRREGYKTIGDLKGYGKLQSLGRTGMEEIARALAKLNVRF